MLMIVNALSLAYSAYATNFLVFLKPVLYSVLWQHSFYYHQILGPKSNLLNQYTALHMHILFVLYVLHVVPCF